MSPASVFFDKMTGSGFEPHGFCYLWMPKLILLHVISDAVIALAYFSIPALLVYFVGKRRDVPFTPVFLMFGLFIVACGTTHLLSIYEIWHGAYWLSGYVKALTALVSIATAITMVPLLPRALALKSPTELDRINRELSQTLIEKEKVLEMYRREHRVAATLQDSWLPSSLPLIPGMAFDAVYKPAAPEADIGGDWYDAFLLDSGKLLVTIGDVAGHGLTAAVTMGKLRQALRVLALQMDDPSAILAGAHTVLRMEDEKAMATALVAIYDPATRMLTYASAGHPPPILRNSNGSVTVLNSGDVPIGLGITDTPLTHTAPVPNGSMITVYTDGLIETSRDFTAGLECLKKAMEDPSFTETSRPAEFLVDTVTRDTSLRDDVAILVMHSLDVLLKELDLDLKAVPSNAHVVRQSLSLYLRNIGFSTDRLFDLQVAVGEAVMNVIEHAYATREGHLYVHAQAEDEEVVVEIKDKGEWRDSSPCDGRGRGFLIMRAFTDELLLERTQEGSSVRLVMRGRA